MAKTVAKKTAVVKKVVKKKKKAARPKKSAQKKAATKKAQERWEVQQLGKGAHGISRGDVTWKAQLAKLKAYKRKRGDCNVPNRWAEDKPLGRWVDTQRTLKKALDRGQPGKGMTAARAAKLEALGFAWAASNVDDTRWEAQLARLLAYEAVHGDCKVPHGWAEDPSLGTSLGRWVRTQRQGKKALDRGEASRGMTAARAAKLEVLGFAWELSAAAISERNRESARDDAGWEGWLAKLEAYKRVHGDCNVPQRWAEDPALRMWVTNQRAYKRLLDRSDPSKGMTAARAARLEALGFAWESSKSQQALSVPHAF
jgi:hypothetical protein